MVNNVFDNMTRRTVLKSTGAGALFVATAFGLPRPVGAQTDTPVQKIFRGGAIVTIEGAQPVAEALAIGGGRIIAVGSEAEVMKLATDSTEIIDLNGAALLPGFVDSHGHFMNAPQIVAWANVSGPPVGPATSIAGVVAELKIHAERRNIPEGEWVIGYGYDPTLYSDGREMTRDDIDAVLPNHRVLVIHVSNHG
ncbi:MAG: amidohydrolase family protein, partial [Hyphomicrobiales bacterium]